MNIIGLCASWDYILQLTAFPLRLLLAPSPSLHLYHAWSRSAVTRSHRSGRPPLAGTSIGSGWCAFPCMSLESVYKCTPMKAHGIVRAARKACPGQQVQVPARYHVADAGKQLGQSSITEQSQPNLVSIEIACCTARGTADTQTSCPKATNTRGEPLRRAVFRVRACQTRKRAG